MLEKHLEVYIRYVGNIKCPLNWIGIRRNTIGHAVLTTDVRDYNAGVDDTTGLGLEISIVFLEKPQRLS